MSNVRSPQYKLGRSRRAKGCLLGNRCPWFAFLARSRCSEQRCERVGVPRCRPGSNRRAGPSVLRRSAHQSSAREFSSLRWRGLPVLRRTAHPSRSRNLNEQEASAAVSLLRREPKLKHTRRRESPPFVRCSLQVLSTLQLWFVFELPAGI